MRSSSAVGCGRSNNCVILAMRCAHVPWLPSGGPVPLHPAHLPACASGARPNQKSKPDPTPPEYPIAGGAFNYISMSFGELAAWCAASQRVALATCKARIPWLGPGWGRAQPAMRDSAKTWVVGNQPRLDPSKPKQSLQRTQHTLSQNTPPPRFCRHHADDDNSTNTLFQ